MNYNLCGRCLFKVLCQITSTDLKLKNYVLIWRYNMGLVDRIRNENRERVFKELLGKKYSELKNFDILYNTMEEFLLIDIKRLVIEGNINKAEDTLFSYIEKNKDINVMFIAGEFYTMLMDMSDEELKKNDFSREEINAGLEEIRKIFNAKILTL